MITLDSELRKLLSKTVLLARDAAETGARKALEALAVHEPEPYKHLKKEQGLLRRVLRAQAKQLGDEESRTKKGAYSITHLTDKVAYDQWHRLLFARFLFENSLLISPEHGVAVTFTDCEELAPSIGLRDGWAVAARFAATELPEIFRADDPAGQIELPVEDRKQLLQFVTSLPVEVFLADDSLGWVYQFWQAKRKEEVNDSVKTGKKIGADELAPVTQLFTEDYMVLFLLHNTLGAWWAGQRFPRGVTASTEDEARTKCALPEVYWTYLRFVKNEDGSWRPASGAFDGWPKTAKELKILDPCMGSGHFLVAELPILVVFRMTEEGLTTEEAVVAVLRDNLFGLELDARCAQIAAFNLGLAAWKLGGWQKLPPLNLACSGLAPRAKLEVWTALAGKKEQLRAGMERLYQLFKEGPTLGSLINPRKLGGDLLTAEFHELQPLMQKALANEDARADEITHELAVTAQGLAHAAEILASQFTLVATNVPYLGRGKQDTVLMEYCERVHPEAKTDLATCFVERCISFCAHGGSTALVTPQNWWFLTTYTKFRKRVLTICRIELAATLGEEAWQAFGDRGPMAALMLMTNGIASESHKMSGIDAFPQPTIGLKAKELESGLIRLISQKQQLKNPDHRILVEELESFELLESYAEGLQGVSSADQTRFIRGFWEGVSIEKPWTAMQSSFPETALYAGRQQILNLGELERVAEEQGAAIRGTKAWGKRSVIVRSMRHMSVTQGTGEVFDANVACVLPKKPEHFLPIWAFCCSDRYPASLRKLDKKTGITNATLVKVPFDLAHWQKVAVEKYPNGLPKPFSSDPTQWLFTGDPRGSDQPLQVAVARLTGYLWPRQTGASFPDCPALSPDGLEKLADDDGIVCISAIKGEESAADRLRSLLVAAYGKEWSASKQTDMLAQVDYAGKTLEDWLRNGFFEQHCAIFHHRPFIWQIWDGRKDGFSVLVNYHKLTKANLEKLAYTYLGDWIARQKAAVDAGEAGSDARLQAAKYLQNELKNILEGEQPYDIFVRWKPLDQQPVGWEPDLNDGVRLNIRPFMSAKDVGKKGAGILRSKPNIHWKKDQGTDVASAPWFEIFNGERINDYHLKLEEKRKARAEKKK